MFSEICNVDELVKCNMHRRIGNLEINQHALHFHKSGNEADCGQNVVLSNLNKNFPTFSNLAKIIESAKMLR